LSKRLLGFGGGSVLGGSGGQDPSLVEKDYWAVAFRAPVVARPEVAEVAVYCSGTDGDVVAVSLFVSTAGL